MPRKWLEGFAVNIQYPLFINHLSHHLELEAPAMELLSITLSSQFFLDTVLFSFTSATFAVFILMSISLNTTSLYFQILLIVLTKIQVHGRPDCKLFPLTVIILSFQSKIIVSKNVFASSPESAFSTLWLTLSCQFATRFICSLYIISNSIHNLKLVHYLNGKT